MRVPLWTVVKEKTIKTILRDALLERGQVSKVVTVHAHEAFWFENKRGRRRMFMENLLRRELGRPMTPGTPEWRFDESGTNGEEEEVSDGVSDATSDASRWISMMCPVGTSSSTSRAELARRWIRSLPSKSRERLERRLERRQTRWRCGRWWRRHGGGRHEGEAELRRRSEAARDVSSHRVVI